MEYCEDMTARTRNAQEYLNRKAAEYYTRETRKANAGAEICRVLFSIVTGCMIAYILFGCSTPSFVVKSNLEYNLEQCMTDTECLEAYEALHEYSEEE